MNLGLNCQLHDCVYFFLSVSRVRAFDYYVCCFGLLVVVTTVDAVYTLYILFGISYKIIFFFRSSSCPLSVSLSLSHMLADLIVHSLGRSGVPTMFHLFLFSSFIIRYKILHYCNFSCAYAFVLLLRSKQNLYDLLSIEDD